MCTDSRVLNTIAASLSTLENLKVNGCNKTIEDLSKKVNTLISLIYHYTLIESDSFDTDDEILNWTTADIVDDLSSAIWNLASGFYKTSASSQRGALEIAVVSLYFQVLENDNSDDNSYNKTFTNWDCGKSPTPNWRVTKPLLKKQFFVDKFNQEHNICVIDNAYKHFKFLCSFTHSRAISPEDGGGANSLNIGAPIGEYNKAEFIRISTSLDDTISHIASIWSVTFPHIINLWTAHGNAHESIDINELFKSKKVLDFANLNDYT